MENAGAGRALLRRVGCAGGFAGVGVVVAGVVAAAAIDRDRREELCTAEIRLLETLVSRHAELRPLVPGAVPSEVTLLAERSLEPESVCVGPGLERSRFLAMQLCDLPERTPAVTAFCGEI